MKTLFIYNPHAGMMQIKNHLFNILNTFAAADYDMTVVPTRKQGEAFSFVRKHVSEFASVICSGGDGTLNEVVNGLLKSGQEELPALGYIPAGSTNDFASSLKLPKSMEKAAELITSGIPVSYDVGLFNTKFFVYIAAFGAFTKVSYSTPQDAKNILGHMAYLVEGIKSLAEIKAYKMKIRYDDMSIEGKFIYGMVTNTLSVGGMYKLDPKKVKLDDGELEVLLIREPKNVGELSEISSYMLGTLDRSDLVLSFKTKKISFENSSNVP
ncbi:MAG: YegS/Rv2252/BmrU family lipid kinase, partial [Erysipelotrichaceae bacterium]|nr:YegS/Rv2252/BmrU family lipid kinase [Erysipelotrichaceae bacterium]